MITALLFGEFDEAPFLIITVSSLIRMVIRMCVYVVLLSLQITSVKLTVWKIMSNVWSFHSPIQPPSDWNPDFLLCSSSMSYLKTFLFFFLNQKLAFSLVWYLFSFWSCLSYHHTVAPPMSALPPGWRGCLALLNFLFFCPPTCVSLVSK